MDVADNYTRFLLLRHKDSEDDEQATPQTNEPTFYRATSASTLQNLLRNPSIHLIAIHSRAYPRPSAKTNGNAIQQNAKIQAAQQAYMEKYNKRYLVEVVGEVGDDVPGLTKL
jgi:prephenate dehydratase